MFYTHFKIPFLQLENYDLNVKIVKLIPKETAEQFKILAIDKNGNILTVAITDEKDKIILPFLAEALDLIIMPVLVNFDTWSEVVQSAYIEKEKQLNYIG